MRSKTSCFNGPLYRKTVLRLWPVWAAAAAVFFFTLPASLWQEFSEGLRRLLEAGPQYLAQDRVCIFVRDLPVFMAILSCVTGLFVWSWLFTARSANCHFALPLRREGLFLTNYLAGLTITLIPLVITFVLTAAVELCFGGLHLPSLLMMLGVGACSAVLFFSLATLCAVATGNIVAMPVFFVILNVLAVAIYELAISLGASFIFGLDADAIPRGVRWLTPIWQLRGCIPEEAHVIYINTTFYYNSGIANAWYFPVYAGAGVVLAAAALLVFRRRPAESAGDLIAFRWLRPIFQIGLALCFAVAMALFIQQSYLRSVTFPVTVVMIVVWSFVGYFGAEMLLRKTFRVFRRGRLRTWAIVAAAAVAVLGMAKLDVFGYTRYIPAEEKVESVSLYAFGASVDADYATASGLHQAILDGSRDGDSYNVNISYTLRSGREVSRSFSVDSGTPEYAALREWATQPETLIAAAFGTMESADQLGWVTVNDWQSGDYPTYEGDSETAAAICNALLADFREGQSAFDYQYGERPQTVLYSIEICYFPDPFDPAKYASRTEYRSDSPTNWSYLYVTENMTHTVALLESLDLSEDGNPGAEGVEIVDTKAM